MLLLAGDALWRRLLQLGVDVAGNQQGDLVNLEQSIHTAALEVLRCSMHPKQVCCDSVTGSSKHLWNDF